MGRSSRDIETILGYSGRAMIHRDDMALGGNKPFPSYCIGDEMLRLLMSVAVLVVVRRRACAPRNSPRSPARSSRPLPHGLLLLVFDRAPGCRRSATRRAVQGRHEMVQLASPAGLPDWASAAQRSTTKRDELRLLLENQTGAAEPQ